MLAINIEIQGDKVVINGLNQLAHAMPKAAERGIKKIVRGTHRISMDFLNGAAKVNAPTSGKQKIKVALPGGGYPVPVRTGNLKRLLDFVDPGQSKDGFAARHDEAIVYNSAEYGRVIHEGYGSSKKFGPRRYLTDALDRFNQSGQIVASIENEIQAEISKRGLA